ncbi:MAG: class I SAM-dependent methyltransferase, partial [Legionella sp.]
MMNKEYIINTNEKARERLDLQHSLYVKNSVALLQEAGVGPGMSGLEIGCG